MNPPHADPLARETALELDRTDPLGPFRERFGIEGNRLYMDGNSLGRPPVRADEAVAQAMAAWRSDLIIAWRDWIRVPRRLGDLIATRIVEAKAGEVIVGDSTSIDLYKAAAAALSARPDRTTLITSDDNFPTDLYVLQSLAAQRSLRLKVLPADAVNGLATSVLAGAVDGDTALVCLSHVAYRSGALLDMAEVTQVAHAVGALILWDVSHSAGSVAVPLESSGADLAVGCTYKYLCGGPGAPAFGYVRTAHQGTLHQPIWGWFGHREQFAMPADFEPADGIESFLVGVPAILSTIAMEPGLSVIAEAGIDRLQQKGRRMTALLIDLADAWLAPHGFSIASPRDADRRGAHVTLRHPNARNVVRALIADGIVPDYRPPDMVRFGPAPLYTRFVDVWDALDRLRRLCEQQPALVAPP